MLTFLGEVLSVTTLSPKKHLNDLRDLRCFLLFCPMFFFGVSKKIVVPQNGWFIISSKPY